MHLALPSLFLALTVGQVPRECYQTANFVVHADSPAAAKRVGDAAETYRKDLAKLWLGKELSDWSAPCRIDFDEADRAGGATEISYSEGKVLFHKVRVRGSLEGVVKGPLPHELTHVLFAHHFGRRLPRWADEGGAIVSEGEAQGAKHRKTFRDILAQGRQFPLRDLLGMDQYPSDIPCLYTQSHSVAGFLVAAKGHQAFLAFVRTGIEGSWDDAAREQYGYQSVEQLEQAWLESLDKQAKANR
jgi:hypothetical protein